MFWNRSNAIGLALASCSLCAGQGMREIRGGAERPCSCVFRAIFRACYHRFRQLAEEGMPSGTVSLEFSQGPMGCRMYGRKREEFIADFCLIARRELSENDYKLFRYTFLLGAGWKLCCARLNLDRGTYFHHLYRIEGILGRNYAEIEPYPLYPVDEYFGGSVRRRSLTDLRDRMPAARIRCQPESRLPMIA
jgi:hypothetical protein